MGWDDSDEDDWEKAETPYKPKTEWDDEDASEEDTPVAVSAAKLPPTEGSGKKKRSLKQILKEREEKEAARRAEIEALEAADEEMTLEERKRREQEQILAADLQNAEDLFAETAVDDKKKKEGGVADPLYMKPTGPKDFKVHGDALVTHLLSLQKVKGYGLFLERVVKGVGADLSVEDLNNLTSVLKVLINTKTQEQRKKDGKKKSKRPTLQSAQNTIDDGSQYNEYDDFM